MRREMYSPAARKSRALSPPPSPLRFFSPMRGETPASTPGRHQTFSASMMEENIDIAELVVTKWDVDGSSYCKLEPLFTEDRKEAKMFLRSVRDLQKAMNYFASGHSKSGSMVRAQSLMQVAMKRLQKEFYQVLSRNRSYLDPETVSVSMRSSRASTARSSVSDFEDYSSEEEIQTTSDSITQVERVSEMAMADLKAIADCMISSGYTNECVKVYKLLRKSIVDESLYSLGVVGLSLSQIQKMDWELIELKIKSWLSAVKIAVNTLFNGERTLCDYVFSSSPRIAESCFAEISRDGALNLFGFPELVAKSKKLSPEKIFRILDIYNSIADSWPEIESIFSYVTLSAVRTQAVTSLIKLGEGVRSMLSDFEMAIQKDVSKSPVPGGGVHPLTRYVMNYLVFLSDYSGVLSDIVADWPLSNQFPLPETYFSSPIPGEEEASVISVRLAWIVLVLLCKLDAKAELYKDVSLSYLFLANNLNYVVSKVRNSNLKLLLGEQWLLKHEGNVKKYASNYERVGWSKVAASLSKLNQTTNDSPAASAELIRGFNTAFEEAYRKQTAWVVPDSKLRDEIKISLAGKIVPPYRNLYIKYRGTVGARPGMEPLIRYAPEDLANFLSDLFFGVTDSGSTPYHSHSSSSSSSHSSSSSSRSREQKGR